MDEPPRPNDTQSDTIDSADTLTRRDFLRRTALTVGGLVASTTLPPSPARAATTPNIQGQPPPWDNSRNPYSTRRPVAAQRGVVATSTPLAVEAGLLMLKNGGSAVDAAIAAAIAQTVVEPVSNGVGADAFALVWDNKTRKLYGLNGSGRAPAALTLQLARNKGYRTMPLRGWLPVTVPGAPALWRDLHTRFGKLPFHKLFEPAIAHAEQGYRVTPIVASAWQNAVPIYRANRGPEFQGWMEMFAPGGRAPRSGETWSAKPSVRPYGA